VKVPFLVIGGGLSGLAAAIRAARFSPDVLLIEKHSRIGGLNSYFYRNRTLYETGLHAITNYAEPSAKKAPLNRLFRQLKLRRKDFSLCQQLHSEIVFRNCETLKFSNNFELFETEVCTKFPESADKFQDLLSFLHDLDPFRPTPFQSAKQFLLNLLENPLLTEMLLCPLMYYGSSIEEDMDLNQFAIMFQAIFQEGMFRPDGTIKDFLDLLLNHYKELGGTIRTNCGVKTILHKNNHAIGVELESGEIIESSHTLSTIGHEETLKLLSEVPSPPSPSLTRLGFIETIYNVDTSKGSELPDDTTIIFFNEGNRFSFKKPENFVDFSSGVICFPASFDGVQPKPYLEVRATHLANYEKWKSLIVNKENYNAQKLRMSDNTIACLENIIGSFKPNIVYQDTFTPVTIERYTSKIGGAIYGSPVKIKDGDLGFTNLFLAGTDQGFLGIVGSMLSGVSIVNQHILPKL